MGPGIGPWHWAPRGARRTCPQPQGPCTVLACAPCVLQSNGAAVRRTRWPSPCVPPVRACSHTPSPAACAELARRVCDTVSAGGAWTSLQTCIAVRRSAARRNIRPAHRNGRVCNATACCAQQDSVIRRRAFPPVRTRCSPEPPACPPNATFRCRISHNVVSPFRNVLQVHMIAENRNATNALLDHTLHVALRSRQASSSLGGRPTQHCRLTSPNARSPRRTLLFTDSAVV